MQGSWGRTGPGALEEQRGLSDWSRRSEGTKAEGRAFAFTPEKLEPWRVVGRGGREPYSGARGLPLVSSLGRTDL